jgi:hypothetical protein
MIILYYVYIYSEAVLTCHGVVTNQFRVALYGILVVHLSKYNLKNTRMFSATTYIFISPLWYTYLSVN